MEADAAQKRSVMLLNNARQLAAFREYRIFPLFPPGRRLFFSPKRLVSNGHPRLFVFSLSSLPKNTF